MKKNIKLSEQHSELVRENMANFSNKVLRNLTETMHIGGAGGFSEAFLQGGWKRSVQI